MQSFVLQSLLCLMAPAYICAIHIPASLKSAFGSQVGSGVQVLGVGLERTGSESLNAALTTMGFKAAHGFETVTQHWDKFVMWRCENWTTKAQWLHEKGFTALTDNPYRAYFEEIMAEYPGVKMILTVHPGGPEGWANSTERLFGVRESPSIYTDWNQHVINTVPKDQLLVHDATQGYKPIADFLGLPVPAGEYPYISQTVLYADTTHEAAFNVRLKLFGCPNGQPVDNRWSMPI